MNLLKTASDKMKAGSAAEKDALCRILFLNLRVDNEKVTSYLWREPFASLVKVTELSSGGDKAKTFEPLGSVVDWLIANPNPGWSLQLNEASQVKIEHSWQY